MSYSNLQHPKKFFRGILAGTFIISLLFCCCVPNQVQAQDKVPSCHQTQKTSETDQNKHNSECDHALSAIKTDSVILIKSVQSTFTFTTETTGKVNSYFAFADHKVRNTSPPEVFQDIPLYTQHSILRI